MAVAPGIHIVEEFEKAFQVQFYETSIYLIKNNRKKMFYFILNYFQDCVAALTNQDLHNARDSDEIRTCTYLHFFFVSLIFSTKNISHCHYTLLVQ